MPKFETSFHVFRLRSAYKAKKIILRDGKLASIKVRFLRDSTNWEALCWGKNRTQY